MNVRNLIFVAIVLVAGAPATQAQQTLNDLEQRLQNELPNPPAAGAAATENEPGYLGILANESSPPGRGVRLVDVLPDGPAAAAGLQVGDLMTSIDGRGVRTLDDLAQLLASRVVGERPTFVVIRGLDALRIDVALTKRPPPEARRFPNFGRIGAPAAPESAAVESPVELEPPPAQPQPTIVAPAPPVQLPNPSASTAAPNGPSLGVAPPANSAPRTGLLGIRAVEVTPELALAMNLPKPTGAMIVEVRPQSPAALAGVPVGAVITSAMGRAVSGPADLADVVRSLGEGAEVKLSYTRFGQSTEKTIKLAAPPAAVPQPSAAAPTEPVLPVAPKSVAEENALLRRKLEQLEARLKELEGAAAKQPAAPSQP